MDDKISVEIRKTKTEIAAMEKQIIELQGYLKGLEYAAEATKTP